MSLKDKNVLISGGSAGIGKSIIQVLVNYGVQDIAVIGRRKEPLDALKERTNTFSLCSSGGHLSIIPLCQFLALGGWHSFLNRQVTYFLISISFSFY